MAVLAGSESYDSIKIGFADAIRDINDIIKEGHLEIRPGQKFLWRFSLEVITRLE